MASLELIVSLILALFTMYEFKRTHTFENRIDESTRMLKKYPQRVPIILEEDPLTSPPPIDKHKYLVPRDATMGQFLLTIRKRMKLHEAVALFLVVSGDLLPMSHLAGSVYDAKVANDGFLYCVYSTETSFGAS